MTPLQLDRRASLLARSDAALARWPERAGTAFVQEMTEVAEGLARLARAADAGNGDPLERARTWRHVGNACFDLGQGSAGPALEQAADAFRSAERLVDAAHAPVEAIKLAHSFGLTLLQLSAGRDLRLATEARERIAAALALAGRHMPEGVSDLRQALSDADRVIALLQQADGLGRRIDALKDTLRAANAPASAASNPVQAAFETLRQAFDRDRPSLEPTRRSGIEAVMASLGDVVAATGKERSLEEMLADRGKLDALARRMQSRAKRPSFKGPGPAPGSRGARVLEALQELKLFVGEAGMDAGSPPGVRESAMALYAQIGRVSTWLSERAADASAVRKLELDETRPLAHEVRMFARRAHLMLARPVWPRYRGAVEASRLFYSGPARLRPQLAETAAALELELDHPARPGADFAEQRWQDLRAANVAVFDLSDADPQVYYELGIALAVGTQLLLTAQEATRVPFDVAQSVHHYPAGRDSGAFLAEELDAAMYGLHAAAGGSSLEGTAAFAQRLAAESGNPLLRVASTTVRDASTDPVRLSDALRGLCALLGTPAYEMLLTRWAGTYPDRLAPRCFAVMPFCGPPERAYPVVAEAARRASVEPVRGDVADGQQIVESIWDEICRATHVTVDLTGFNLNVCLELGIAHALGRRTLLIGAEGTERVLETKLPGVAKWRCHTYPEDPAAGRGVRTALEAFFARPLAG